MVIRFFCDRPRSRMNRSPQISPALSLGASFVDQLLEALRKLLGFPIFVPSPARSGRFYFPRRIGSRDISIFAQRNTMAKIETSRMVRR